MIDFPKIKTRYLEARLQYISDTHLSGRRITWHRHRLLASEAQQIHAELNRRAKNVRREQPVPTELDETKAQLEQAMALVADYRRELVRCLGGRW